MTGACIAARACSALPVAPRTRLAFYKQLARLTAPRLDEALAMLKARRLFLVSSTGRTGTTWLATLLNRVEDCHVVHEPVPLEQCAHVQALQDQDSVREYIDDFRIREVAWRLKDDACNTYGEVNGALRRHVEYLREVLPHLHVVHLIRDPRDVIRSMLNRAALAANDKVYAELEYPANISHAAWIDMDRFAKLCWLWSEDNAYLRLHADGRAYFEEITQNFDSFRAQILEPLGLRCTKAMWAEHRRVGRNETVSRDDQYEAWTQQQNTTFEQFVGPELEHYPHYARFQS